MSYIKLKEGHIGEDWKYEGIYADAPVYIRGSGKYGDQQHAGEFKAYMINLLGVEEFYLYWNLQ